MNLQARALLSEPELFMSGLIPSSLGVESFTGWFPIAVGLALIVIGEVLPNADGMDSETITAEDIGQKAISDHRALLRFRRELM